MSVLICKNIETEGPGTIEDYLRLKELPYTVVELSKGEEIPVTNDFDTLVIMGGPMSANEGEKYPYIKEEEMLVRDFVKKDRKILGICLGAQIIARAIGSRVYRGHEEEIGWYDIELTGEGLRDRLLEKLALHPVVRDFWKRFKVFHWHGETFDIPGGAARLAKSELYPNQAFKYGNSAYAFQFHIEASREMIYSWFSKETDINRKIRDETEKFYDVYRARAMNFYERFFS